MGLSHHLTSGGRAANARQPLTTSDLEQVSSIAFPENCGWRKHTNAIENESEQLSATAAV